MHSLAVSTFSILFVKSLNFHWPQAIMFCGALIAGCDAIYLITEHLKLCLGSNPVPNQQAEQ